jgi:myosin heavy chain 9/10/11/14
LKVRVVDLETKSYANTPRTVSRRRESRIEELASQLQQSNKEKNENSRTHRTPDQIARDAKIQQAESDRLRQRMEEERQAYESQIQSLREAMDSLQTEESALQLAKRRAEREAADYKQKFLRRVSDKILARLHGSSPAFAVTVLKQRSND